ncbi:MAG: fibronectin type III domain-containing protein, partial [Actinomycetota bacterium]
GTITSYDVRYATNSAMTNPTTITGATTTAPTAGSPYLVTGLTAGTTYFFQVRAVNAAGAAAWGPATAVAATPYTTPSAVTSLTIGAGSTQVNLSWGAPVNGGSAITRYDVQYSTSAAMTSPTTVTGATTGATTYTQTGLVNGTTYYFKVRAANAAGPGEWGPIAPVAVTPYGAPDAVTSLSATPGNTQVALSWAAPYAGSRTITGYNVRYSTSAAMTSPVVVTGATTGATTYTRTGLLNGTTYYFQVQGVIGTLVGAWGPTTPTASMPATVPGAPGTPTVVRDGFGSVRLTTTAPSATGGSAITSYTFRYATGAPAGTTACTTTTLTCQVTGLTQGTSYTFTVVATNVLGNSVASAASAAVTPAYLIPFATNASVASSSQLNLVPNSSGTVPIGARLLLYFTADTTSSTAPTATVSFPNGGVASCTTSYTAINSGTATAGSGIRGGVLYCNVTTAIPAGGQVRITLSSVAPRAVAMGEYLVGYSSGGTVTTVAQTKNIATAPASGSMTSTPVGIVFGAWSYEDGTLALAADSDTTSGTWSSPMTQANGIAGATGLTVTRQYKWVTATSTQQYNSSTATLAGEDWIASILRIS